MQPLNTRVLWVEDDADTREVITFFLEQSGYWVTSAGSSIEALGLARSEHFDLYLLGDWRPHGKESNLCEEIHKSDPGGPILFYSAAAYQTDRQRGMEAGANGYLTKPVGFDHLKEAMTRLLNDATSDIDEGA